MPKFALIQFSSGPKKDENLKKAIKIVDELPDDVDMAIFPEYMMGYHENGLTRKFLMELAEPVEGPFISTLRDLARRKGLYIVANFFEKRKGKPGNVNVVIGRRGEMTAKYTKIHLFDVYGFEESSFFEPGNETVVFELRGLRIGIATCFDVRFPELFRQMALKGAEAFILPSAWYEGLTKEEQWFIMGRARAHENVAFLLAVGNSAKPFIGRSFVADPFGIVRLDLGKGEKVGFFGLDRKEIVEARNVLPLLDLRRPDVYG